MNRGDIFDAAEVELPSAAVVHGMCFGHALAGEPLADLEIGDDRRAGPLGQGQRIGEVVLDAKTPLLKVSGTAQAFVLKDAPSKAGVKSPLERLRAAVASGDKVVSVTGRVEGWNGRFPVVLSALAKRPPDVPGVLFVTDFETNKK